MRRKLLGMLLVACVLLGSASCGAAEKLVVWGQTEHNEVFRRMIGPFEEKYGVTVEFIDIHPLGQREKLVLDGPAGKRPGRCFLAPRRSGISGTPGACCSS